MNRQPLDVIMNLVRRIKISLLVKPPKWLRQFTSSMVWRIDTKEPSVFLTFDDGPVPGVTPWVLDQLDLYKAKATFFCVGENVFKYPDLFKRILESGHSVGNHSYSHLNGFRCSVHHYVDDVNRARCLIDSRLFRPPFGRLSFLANRILKSQYKIIMWDVLSMDYNPELEPQIVLNNVISKTVPGSIVVFHDSYIAFENLRTALPGSLKELHRKGYTFRALNDVI